MRSRFVCLSLPFIPNLRNGPIPRLKDAPKKRHGNNTMHMQKVTVSIIVVGIAYQKFILPME